MKTMLVRSRNLSATEYYYDIIARALAECGELVFDGLEGQRLPAGNRDALVVVGSCTSMLRLWLKGYRKIAVWYQGILPEESFLRRRSRLRKRILEQIEAFSLRHAVFHFFVSEIMREYYEEKYHIRFNTFYTMPCFNAEFQHQSVRQKSYDGKVFAYIGSLSKWQCIDQTLAMYRRIEEASGNTTTLLLLTPELEKARQLAQRHGIRNVQVRHVHYTQLAQELRTVSFGFVLREDTPVNRVATPTKFANYAANGIIPVYSGCVRDFFEISRGNPCQIVVEDVNAVKEADIQRVLHMMSAMPSAQEAEMYFSAYFDAYYNARRHSGLIAKKIGEIVAV